MKFKVLFILVGVLGALYSFAQEEAANPAPRDRDFVICKSKKYSRNIQVEKIKSEDAVCRTIYTKGGKTKVIGSARFMDSCYGFLNNITSNLEKAGWKCTDISGTTVIQ